MYLTGIKTYFYLKRNLTRNRSDLLAEQWRNFCKLVAFAYNQVPFYRQHYDKNKFKPEQLKTPDDIRRVPVVRKSMFQETVPDKLIAEGFLIDNLLKKRTSGSSGSPLNVYYTKEDRIYRTLLHLRIFFHNGMTFRDKMAHISDSRNVPDFRYSFQKLGFLEKEFIYAADPSDLQMVKLAQMDPAIIYSYSSSMVLLAAEISKLGNCPIDPLLIFTTGELLSPDDRKLINHAFGIELRDIYGIVEMGDIAWQCPEVSGYHLNIDSFLPEILEDDEPVAAGKTGRLVITNLHSKAMPFIRYEVGDYVTAPTDETCPCGCQFPKIEVVQGRADDWLYTVDGKKISPLIFVVASIPGVQQYRMIQKRYDWLIVEILPGSGFSEVTMRKVADHVSEVMGPGMEVEVVQVESIPQQSGKMRRVISEIDTSKP